MVQINIKGAQVSAAKHTVDDSAYKAAVDRYERNQSLVGVAQSALKLGASLDAEKKQKAGSKAEGQLQTWDKTEREGLLKDATERGDLDAKRNEFTNLSGIGDDPYSSPAFKPTYKPALGSLTKIDGGSPGVNSRLEDQKTIASYEQQKAYEQGYDSSLLRSTFENIPPDELGVLKRAEIAMGNMDALEGKFVDQGASEDSFTEVFTQYVLGNLEQETPDTIIDYQGDYYGEIDDVLVRAGAPSEARYTAKKILNQKIVEEVMSDPGAFAFRVRNNQNVQGITERAGLPREVLSKLQRQTRNFEEVEARVNAPKGIDIGTVSGFAWLQKNLPLGDVIEYAEHHNDKILSNGMDPGDEKLLITVPRSVPDSAGGGRMIFHEVPVSTEVHPGELGNLPLGWSLAYPVSGARVSGAGTGGPGGYSVGGGGGGGSRGRVDPDPHPDFVPETHDGMIRNALTEAFFPQDSKYIDELEGKDQDASIEQMIKLVMTKWDNSPMSNPNLPLSKDTISAQVAWLREKGMHMGIGGDGLPSVVWDRYGLLELSGQQARDLGIRKPTQADLPATFTYRGSGEPTLTLLDGTPIVKHTEPWYEMLQNVTVALTEGGEGGENAYGPYWLSTGIPNPTALAELFQETATADGFDWGDFSLDSAMANFAALIPDPFDQKAALESIVALDPDDPDFEEHVNAIHAGLTAAEVVALVKTAQTATNLAIYKSHRIPPLSSVASKLDLLLKPSPSSAGALSKDQLMAVLKRAGATTDDMAMILANAADEVAASGAGGTRGAGAATARANRAQAISWLRDTVKTDRALLKIVMKELRKPAVDVAKSVTKSVVKAVVKSPWTLAKALFTVKNIVKGVTYYAGEYTFGVTTKALLGHDRQKDTDELLTRAGLPTGSPWSHLVQLVTEEGDLDSPGDWVKGAGLTVATAADMAIEYFSLGQLSVEEIGALGAGLVAKSRQSSGLVTQERQLQSHQRATTRTALVSKIVLATGNVSRKSAPAGTTIQAEAVTEAWLRSVPLPPGILPPGLATDTRNHELEESVAVLANITGVDPSRIHNALSSNEVGRIDRIPPEEYDDVVRELNHLATGRWVNPDVTPEQAAQALQVLGQYANHNPVNVANLLDEVAAGSSAPGDISDLTANLDLSEGGPLSDYVSRFRDYYSIEPGTEINVDQYTKWVALGMPLRGADGKEFWMAKPPILPALMIDDQFDYNKVAALNVNSETGKYTFTTFLSEDAPGFLAYLEAEKVTPSNPAEMKAAYGDFLEMVDNSARRSNAVGGFLDDGLSKVLNATIEGAGAMVSHLAAGYERREQLIAAQQTSDTMRYMGDSNVSIHGEAATEAAWLKDFQSKAQIALSAITPGSTGWPSRYADTPEGAIWDFTKTKTVEETTSEIERRIEHLNEKISLESSRPPARFGSDISRSREERIARMQESIVTLRGLGNQLQLGHTAWMDSPSEAPLPYHGKVGLRWQSYHGRYPWGSYDGG